MKTMWNNGEDTIFTNSVYIQSPQTFHLTLTCDHCFSSLQMKLFSVYSVLTHCVEAKEVKDVQQSRHTVFHPQLQMVL